MDQKEQDERNAVVMMAKSWLGTPYHTAARIRGVGADCATMVAGAYEDARMIPAQDIAHYPPDWHLHRGTERYLAQVLQYAKELPEDHPRAKLPGNLVLYRFGRCFSHAAIIVQWPQIAHAYVGRNCTLDDGDASWLTTIGENGPDTGKKRPRKFMSLWEA